MISILGCKVFLGSAFERYAEKCQFDFRGIDVDTYDLFKGKATDVFINVNGNSKKFIAKEDPKLDYRLSVESVLNSIFDFSYHTYIYISSVDVYTHFSDQSKNSEHASIDASLQSNYGFHKYLAEEIVKKYCKRWLIFRLGGMVGKHMVKSPVFDILNNKPLWVHASSRYQYINTDQVAEIVMKMYETGCQNEIFNLCGKGTIALSKIAKMAQRKTMYKQKNVPVQHYEINCQKIQKMIKLPHTEHTIASFLSLK